MADGVSPSPPPRNKTRIWWILAGALLGDLAMAGLYAGLIYLGQRVHPFNGSTGVVWLVTVPSLFFIPLVGGLVAAWVWRRLDLTSGTALAHSLWMLLFGLLGAYSIFREGVICLLIASPLLCGSIFVGVSVGRVWFKIDRSRLNLCIFPLLILVAWGEMENRTYPREAVADEVLIHAPPEKVWPHVLAFSPIAEPPRYWLFRIGLPYPMATTNTGNFAGAERRCIFSSGVTFKELVAVYDPPRRLTFDIYEQLRDPEAYGHITLHRGQFDLRDNHDGTTTLIGTSWYTLHVRPLFYFDWWTQDMMHAVHLRVMNHIRDLVENSP